MARSAHNGPLKPVYAITSDEPLLADEAAARVRERLQEAGVGERRLFQAEAGFDWAAWLAEAAAPSLFASRQLIELHIPSGKPGVEGARAIEAWCAHPPADTVLLVRLPRLDKKAQAAGWYAALARVGEVIAPQPPTPARLPEWIGARLMQRGLKADTETLRFLAEQVEGNLLAAQQEVDKLSLLLPPGPVRLADVRATIVDLARFDAFQLAEALLAGEAPRLIRILRGLKAEGETPLLALWVLTQEVRTLYRVAVAVDRGEPLAAACARLKVWASRQALVARALGRLDAGRLARALAEAARIDRAAKGLERADAWRLLEGWALALAGGRLPEAMGVGT
ncbi:MAG: DNA polymerase III subunit delta [Thiobacillaceae bacterium]|nr:DNA polymerase III subunit delta [Thiobacillaceae bacterium]MDW8324597.1 DNA polymerase III subunit delta [Burkholderiales bacterium]